MKANDVAKEFHVVCFGGSAGGLDAYIRLHYLLSSHVWRQDHNGFSHQDPGFIDVAASKKSAVVRAYLPPDANTLLSVTDHCLQSRNSVKSLHVRGFKKRQMVAVPGGKNSLYLQT